MSDNLDLARRVFGDEAKGETYEEMAISSKRIFVRGQTMLAVDSEQATGRRLTALEALTAFGIEILARAVSDGQSAIVPDRSEPASSLRNQRKRLGYKIPDLARISGLSTEQIELAETDGKRSPIRILERLAPPLALDERFLGVASGARADQHLGVRLRELSQASNRGRRLSPSMVGSLAEAAWVISRQQSLARSLGDQAPSILGKFKADPDYSIPTYKVGYRLARQTREYLGIGSEDPIPSMRTLIGHTLRIPLVEAPIGQTFAGATLANSGDRGIVVNTEGANSNVWVRRMTMAHELGHLLWDPDQRLNHLMVDSYSDINEGRQTGNDAVEIRANAFAIAFLAPSQAVQRLIDTSVSLEEAAGKVVDRFGISWSAAKAHVGNVVGALITAGPGRHLEPSTDLRAAEDGPNDFFPLGAVPPSRRGLFAWLVIQNLEHNLITADTASMLLNVNAQELEQRKDQIVNQTAPVS